MFPHLVDKIPEGNIGTARIEHFSVSKKESDFSLLRARINHRYGEYVGSGEYARLYIKNDLVMSDTGMEQETNQAIVKHVKGDVLIAGLGLGMIIWPILDNKKVKSLTVLEINPDVIALVHPYLPKDARLKVLHADAFQWRPSSNRRYNTIYFDIWANFCTDYWRDVEKLKKRFERYKTPNAWVGDWITEYHRINK